MISPIGAHVAAVSACTAAVGICIIQGRGLARPPCPAFVTYITETKRHQQQALTSRSTIIYSLRRTAVVTFTVYSILQW